MDDLSGFRPKSILSLPVYNPREEVGFNGKISSYILHLSFFYQILNTVSLLQLVGVAIAINKTAAAGINYGQFFFSEEDEKVGKHRSFKMRLTPIIFELLGY